MQYLSNHRRTESSFLHRCFFPSLMGNCVDCVIDINTAAGRMIAITEFCGGGGIKCCAPP